MQNRKLRSLTLLSCVGAAALANVGCGGSSGDQGGSGGRGATGGHGTAGGTSPTGGSGGHAGAAATGGSAFGPGGHAGAGGAANGSSGEGGTGGTAPAGGVGGITPSGTGGTGLGGAGGSGPGGAGGSAPGGAGGSAAGGRATGGSPGGHTGTGGSTTDASTTAAFRFTFDHNTEGFIPNDYAPSGRDVNIASLDAGSAGGPVVDWDSGVGDPNNGSLRVAGTFTGYDQILLTTLTLSPEIDAAGKTLHAFVMLDATVGGHPFTGTVQVVANTGGAFNGAGSALTTLAAGQWKEVTFNLASPASPFDASQLHEIGFQFSTGVAPDGDSFAGPVHATFHIDTISDGSGDASPPALDYTFDTSQQDFSISDPTFPGAGAATGPRLKWDSTVGDPTPGSLALNIPFSGYNQSVDVQLNLWPPADATGKTVHAKVMLDAVDGGTTTFTGSARYARLHVSGPDFSNEVEGPKVILTTGQWTDVTLNVGAVTGVAGLNPTALLQVGVTVGTGAGAGAFPGTENLTFHIDSIVSQ